MLLAIQSPFSGILVANEDDDHIYTPNSVYSVNFSVHSVVKNIVVILHCVQDDNYIFYFKLFTKLNFNSFIPFTTKPATCLAPSGLKCVLSFLPLG
ncbi:hypothetical protein BCL90_3943 [Pedobacter alluvionis]|uniref:Uncharacterized protein n=1 Tax=Pedobacter alluvionis TaxID=475253 RepID=A0A497XY40_9SPHI|nr:hypothetical protein BCL90_3943 [Pedobacter alluvionis]